MKKTPFKKGKKKLDISDIKAEKALKENHFINLSEVEDDDDLFAGLEDEGAQEEEKKLETNTPVELPTQLKVAFISNNLNDYLNNMWGLHGRAEMQRRIRAGEDGAVLSRSGAIRDKEARDEYNRLLKQGRKVASYVQLSDDRDLNARERNLMAKWFDKKNFNIIAYDSVNGQLTPTGKATLNFLARILSNQPQGDDERIMVDSGMYKAFMHTAENILRSFYGLVIPKYALLLSKKQKLTPELEEFTMDAVDHAVDRLRAGQYSASRDNVGAWFIQVAKNKIIDYLRKVSDYQLDLARAQEELETRKTSSKDGTIYIRSRLAPSESDTSNVMNAPKMGDTFAYQYADIYDALNDLRNQVPHLQHHNMPANEVVKFYASVRKSPMVGNVSQKMLDKVGFQPDFEDFDERVPMQDEAEKAIKGVIKRVIEGMLESSSDIYTKHISKGDFSTAWVNNRLEKTREDLETLRAKGSKRVPEFEAAVDSLEDRAEKIEKSNKLLVDFVYSLLQFSKEEDGGGALSNFVNEFNMETIDQYRGFSEENAKKSDEKIKKELIANKMWIPEVAAEKFAREARSKLRQFFTAPNTARTIKAQSEELYNKIQNLMGLTTVSDIGTRRTFQENIRRVIRKFMLEEEVSMETIAQIGGDIDLDNASEKLNQEIAKIIQGQRSAWTADNARVSNKAKEFEYIVSTLATIYQREDVEVVEKKNIKDYLTYALMAQGDNSSFVNHAFKNAGVSMMHKKSEDALFEDAIIKIYESIQKAIETYSPAREASFLSYARLIAANSVKDVARKHAKMKFTSLDEPAGRGDEGDSAETKASQLPDLGFSREEEKQATAVLSQAIDEYIKRNVIAGNEAWASIYELLTDEPALKNTQIADILGYKEGQVAASKKRMSDKITAQLKDLIGFVLDKTGIDISKYPKIQEILMGGGAFQFGNARKSKADKEQSAEAPEYAEEPAGGYEKFYSTLEEMISKTVKDLLN